MKRIDFLQVLQSVSPALGEESPTPILACLCFDGKRVFTYDGYIAMITDCKTEFKGGLIGSILLGFMQSTTAENMEFTQTDSKLKLKMGRTNLNLPLFSTDNFIFKPDLKEIPPPFDISEDFIKVLDIVLLSAGTEINSPTRLGATFCFDKSELRIISTNNVTLTESVLNLKIPKELYKKEIIVPTRFMDVLQKVNVSDPCTGLALTASGMIVAGFKSGTWLYSKTIVGVNSKQFNKILDLIPDKSAIPITSAFVRCINRACLLNAKKISLELTKEKLTFKTNSDHGNLVETISVQSQYEISIKAAPVFLRNIMDKAETIILDTNMLVFNGQHFTHIVATIQD